jgi:hypothetical protein
MMADRRVILITSRDIRREFYFSAHMGEGLVLCTPDGIPNFTFTLAAAEDLLTNLEISLDIQFAKLERNNDG